MLGLRTVVYKVDELAKAKEWYARSFAAEPYFDEPFYPKIVIRNRNTLDFRSCWSSPRGPSSIVVVSWQVII